MSFLPIPAGSNFLTSINDDSGENLLKVSDILRVLPSPTGNSSCIPSPSRRKFSLNATTVSQCEEMVIRYNASAVARSPTVRFYNPTGSSSELNQTSDDPVQGIAKYLVKFGRGKSVLFLLDDGADVHETTPLLTILGDASSPTSCMKSNKTTTSVTSESAVSSPMTSKAVIIGGSVGGGAVVLIVVGMIIFILRERKRRHRKSINLDSSRLTTTAKDERILRPPPSFTENLSRSGVVSNPIYTKDDFLSPTKPTHTRGSLASWSQDIPEDQRLSAKDHPPLNRHEGERQLGERGSLHSLDIEGLLNLATYQSDNPIRQVSDLVPLEPASNISHRHLGVPSDVPVDLTASRDFSSFSDNPFNNEGPVSQPQSQYFTPISSRMRPLQAVPPAFPERASTISNYSSDWNRDLRDNRR